jgi:hypothetical protein
MDGRRSESEQDLLGPVFQFRNQGFGSGSSYC